MALVNYNSDSDSENEAAPPSAPKPPTTAPKLVDRANPRKIIVNLPSGSANSDEPPTKRARTDGGGGGGGRFSAFRSALPPPKKTVAPVAAPREPQTSSSSSSSSAQPLPFSFFKTSAEAAFSREPPSYSGGDEVDDFGNAHTGAASDRPAAGGGMRMNLPAPKYQASQQQQGPSIPEGQKPESEVKLVGKPLMFRPLSVARKPAKKSGAKTAAAAAASSTTKPAATSSSAGSSTAAATTAAPPAEAPKKKKVSLFSLGAEADEAPQAEEPSAAAEGGYQPLFEDVVTDPATGEAVYSDYATYQAPEGGSSSGPTTRAPAASANYQSLDGVADDLGLSAAARRELFGRGGSAAAQAATASRVINFNLDREYRSNEEMRASGELQAPARVVKGIAPGKHSLRQLVNAVQSQKEALEESFAKNKSTQQEASSRYGWR